MNQLETALVAASEDQSKQAEFYKTLIKSDIYFIPFGRTPETRFGKAIEGQLIRIQQIEMGDGKPYTPFFTSEGALSKFITEQVTYLKVNSISFFEIVKGSEAVLNPGNDFGKLFLKQEILDILSGDIFKLGRQITIEKETSVVVGAPAVVPRDLLRQLGEAYRQYGIVKEAYLAWVKMDRGEEPPHYMVMIRAAVRDEGLFEKNGEIVKRWLGDRREIVDFILDSGDGFSLLVRKSGIRFFRRKLFGIF